MFSGCRRYSKKVDESIDKSSKPYWLFSRYKLALVRQSYSIRTYPIPNHFKLIVDGQSTTV